MTATTKHTILYADDDPDDLFMVTQAFKSYDNDIKIVHAPDGHEALRRLEELVRQKKHPCLIILDINMPGMNGKEALVRIKQSEETKGIPTVIFTTSSSSLDRTFAEKWGAGFITKPLVYAELEELAKTFVNLCDFEMTKRA